MGLLSVFSPTWTPDRLDPVSIPVTMGRTTGTKTERSQISVRAHVCGDQKPALGIAPQVLFALFFSNVVFQWLGPLF